MKKYISIVLLVIVLTVGHFVDGRVKPSARSQSTNTQSENVVPVPSAVSTNQTNEENSVPLPESFQIKNVPFVSQAPMFNWDTLHDEACEETSLIITKYYLTQKELSPEIAETEIQKMVEWEIGYFGSHKDLTAQETVDLAKNFYQLNNLSVKKITSVNDIKTEISQNHLVIVPTAGRLLGNPNFRTPGPVYHMLVISGYDTKGFTTQDVGTKNGKNYYYNQDILFNAIHDWNGAPDINSGEKNIIVVN